MIKNTQRNKVIIVTLALVAIGLYILAEINTWIGIIILILAVIIYTLLSGEHKKQYTHSDFFNLFSQTEDGKKLRIPTWNDLNSYNDDLDRQKIKIEQVAEEGQRYLYAFLDKTGNYKVIEVKLELNEGERIERMFVSNYTYEIEKLGMSDVRSIAYRHTYGRGLSRALSDLKKSLGVEKTEDIFNLIKNSKDEKK